MKYKIEISAGGIVFKNFKAPTSVVQRLWLITQHSLHKGWGFPKGLVGDKDTSERMQDAALREVKEEGGVTAKIVHPQPIIVKYKYRFGDYLVDKKVFYYLMEYLSGDPKDHDWEMMDAKFVKQEEVKNILTFKSDKDAFKRALKLLETG